MGLDNTLNEPQSELKFLSGGGEMGELMRVYDWDSHPLGNPDDWPTSLKNSIQLILNAAFPMFLWWSNDLYMFHNDSYIPALGEKHPEALGSSARVMWAEIWESLWGQLGGSIDSILVQGKHFYAEDLPLALKRKGFLEETFWTFSYSPAYTDEGNIGGMFCSCYESTKKVLGQRRLKTIKDVAAVTVQSRTLPDVWDKLVEVLKENERDLAFSMYYALDGDGKTAILKLNSHNLGEVFALSSINLDDDGGSCKWPFNRVIDQKQHVLLQRFSETNFTFNCIWGDSVEQVVVLPVLRSGQDILNGFFVVGLSPKLEFDDDYLSFLNLLVGQINLAIANIQLLDKEKELLYKTEEERRKLFKVLMQAPIPVCILRGREHVFELINTRYQRLFGTRELVGKPIRVALPEIEGQGIYESLDNVYQTGKAYIGQEIKIRYSQDEGSPLNDAYFTFIYEAYRDDNNEISGIMVLCYDVTAQVLAKQNLSKYNAELALKNKELIKVNSDLDNFIYTASHDLKAPVSNLEGLFNTLFEEIELNEDVTFLKSLIEKSFVRFKNTILDLTEISKAQKDSLEDVELVSVSKLIDEVKEGIKDQIEKHEGEVIENLNVKEIRFSRKNLRSILYNILSNGIKYSKPDLQPILKVSTDHEGDYIVLSISDNGLGIPDGNLDKIFQMFKRLHDHVEGTGVGLYIVKRIIENVGGKIEVFSKVDEGSTFKIYFPNK
jgi:signal transduction histidine kinase